MRQVDIALAYAEKGISVFPVTSKKIPATGVMGIGNRGHRDATTDPATIRRWWLKNPNLLIAAPTENFTVLDIDSHKACNSGKLLTDHALGLLFENGLPDDAVLVTTQSGGEHIYFAPHPDGRRRISVLPNIDLLGSDAGYVILPDQKVYVSQDGNLWDKIDTLPEFPMERFDALVIELAAQTKISKELARAAKEEREGRKANGEKEKVPGRGKKKPVAKTTRERITGDKLVTVRDMTKMPKDILKRIALKKKGRGINYKDNLVYRPQEKNMYETEYHIDHDHPRDDDIIARIDEETFTLDLEAGELSTLQINTLFHYRPLQEYLARWMGLRVPLNIDSPVLQRSILPGHRDLRPSLGVRWNKHHDHLIVRDFSNFFCDEYDQVDYNLVRLYATIRMGCLTPRMKAPEFVVWFLRMCVESGFINVDKFKKKYSMPNSYPGYVTKVAEGFILLDAVKQLYKGYDNTSVFSDRFVVAWCNVTPWTGNQAKKYLVEGGYLHVEGICDCSGGKRGDGFYNTLIYSVMNRDKIQQLKKEREEEKLKEVNNVEQAEETSAEEQQTAVNFIEKEENFEMNEITKKPVTFRGFHINERDHEIITNFCYDMGLPVPPMRKNMFVELATIEGYTDKHQPTQTRSITITDLYLQVVDSMKFDGTKVLVLAGESEELEEMYAEYNSELWKSGLRMMNDSPLIGFAICSNYDEEKFDLSEIAAKFWDYIPDDTITMDTYFSRYTTSSDLYKVLFDGVEPD